MSEQSRNRLVGIKVQSLCFFPHRNIYRALLLRIEHCKTENQYTDFLYIYLCTHQIIYHLVALSQHIMSSNFLFKPEERVPVILTAMVWLDIFNPCQSPPSSAIRFLRCFIFTSLFFCQLCKAISIHLKEILWTIKRTHNGVTHFLK